MKTNTIRFGNRFTYALPWVVAASAALSAQQAGEAVNGNDPIIDLPTTVVTGSLWESELQETTASISVLDEKALSGAELLTFADISSFLPNLTATGGTSRLRYFQVRGIGENSQFEGETPDSAVAFFIDDLDFTGLGSIGSLFDVKQVEVLRGPQAGAFGANAAGGMIRIVSQDPTPFWTGNVQTTAGTDSLLGGEIAVGGPLLARNPEALTMRFAFTQQQSDGFYTNHTLKRDDVDERNELAARLKLRWIPGSEWQWDGTVFYANVDNGYDAFSMSNEPYSTDSDEPGRDEQESFGASLKGRLGATNGYGITTKTSLMQTDSFYSYDADWTAASYAGYLATWRDREVFTQELRLDSASQEQDRWTLGVYFQGLKEDTDVLYRDGDPSGGEWDYGQVNVTSRYETETLAGFGQIEHQLAESTRLVLGLRYELHDVKFDSVSEEQGYYQGYLYDGGSEKEDTVFGGKLTLEHDLDEDVMVFASLTRGYKAGGANSGAFTEPQYPSVYDQELQWNLETGLRGWWLDSRLTAQVTAFYLIREDAQLRDSVGAGGFFRYLTVNGDRATHLGLEAELQWAMNKQWKLAAGFGLLDAQRESYTDPGGEVPEHALANAPAYNYNLRLDYRGELGFFGSLAVTGRDSYYESNSHLQQRDAMTVVNASVGYQYENWRVTLWAKNLLDSAYASRVFFFDNGAGEQRYEALADPRQVGVTISYRY